MNKSTLNQGELDTVNLGRHKFFQPVEHLSFLQKVSQYYVSGKLQVFSISQQWSIYFEQGKLIYACQLNGMWNVFDKKLQQLTEPAKLNNQVYNQLKAIFDSHNDAGYSSYSAICWLVDQQYLNSTQVIQLIEELAIEVMDSFLKLRDGIYELLPNSYLDDLPKFTHIDISTIARRCQDHAQKRGNFIHPVYRTSTYLFSDLSEQERVNLEQRHLSQRPQEALQNHKSKKQVNQYIESTVKTSVKQISNYIDTTLKTPVQTLVKEANSYVETKVQIPAKDVPAKSKTYKVICIDDSPTILKAIKGFLDEELFQVVGITDSLKALMQILRSKPDIILLDISMPNLDGYELCSMLRKHPGFRNTPVIMVTGRTGIIDKARAKLVKASGYLTKPFTQAELIKTVFHQVGCLN
jgi:two-component system, chemotaxis family, response regulator PixG